MDNANCGGRDVAQSLSAIKRFSAFFSTLTICIKLVCLRRHNKDEQDCAALRIGLRIRKQGVLSGDHKRLNAPFRTVFA